jgi:diguanylate cyclase (GGDEF)-like protein
LKNIFRAKLRALSVLIGILIFILFSLIQKFSMDVNLFAIKSSIMPVFIGGIVGFIIGTLLKKNYLLIQQLKFTNATLESQVKKRTMELFEKNQELKKISNTDPLTQISNRRHLDTFLQSECKRLARSDSTLSIILCDIDHFKQYNDRLGHQAGDECLKQVAQLLQSNFNRDSDLVARFGGEEFIIILPNTVKNMAIKLAEKVRLAIEKMRPPSKDFQQHLTMSFGIASTSSNDKLITMSDIIHRADKALYIAKNNGRNAVYSEST